MVLVPTVILKSIQKGREAVVGGMLRPDKPTLRIGVLDEHRSDLRLLAELLGAEAGGQFGDPRAAARDAASE